MNLKLRAAWLAAACAVCASAQPVIGTNGIVNGASFIYAGLPNGKVAQGSIFSIFGQRLGPSTPANANAFPLPTDGGLGGVTVEVTANGVTKNAILLMVSAGQINAILPSSVAVGSANVVVKYNGPSAAAPITVVKSSFGSFASNQGGSGPAILFNYISDANQPQNSVKQAAHPGQVVILWGTGLGPVTFDETRAPGGNATDMKGSLGVTLSVAGMPVTPQYAGRAPGYAGLDQINFQLPANLAAACYVPVTVKIGNVVSNTTTISVATGSGTVCADDFTTGVGGSEGLRTGSISLSRTKVSYGGMDLATTDSAGASFTKIAPADVGKYRNSFGLSTYGACTVLTFNEDHPVGAENIPLTPLDAGSPLTLTLPDNSTKTLTRNGSTGSYALNPPATGLQFLVPGLYKIAAPGGSGPNAVGTFQAQLTVPTPLTWSNMNSLPSPIPRTAGLPIQWTGGDASDAVLIYGMSAMTDGTGAAFYCLAKNSDKHFTIPAEVLLALPPSGDESGGMIGVGDMPKSNKAQFTPNPPNGLDSAFFGYQSMSATMATFQ